LPLKELRSNLGDDKFLTSRSENAEQDARVRRFYVERASRRKKKRRVLEKRDV